MYVMEGLTTLAVLLSLASWINADVIVKIGNSSNPVIKFYDMQADFGPTINSLGITGYVYNVNPANACEIVEPPPDNNSSWIALIARDNCTFVEKIRNVQKWAVAAIVYNHKYDDNLKPMSGDGSGIHIPSVFVGYTDGKTLSLDYCFNCSALGKQRDRYKITIDNKEYNFNPYLVWPFALVVGLCFILIIFFMFVKWCRDLRRKRRSRLSTKHLKKIPTKKFKKGPGTSEGEEYDVCAICLDDYEEGDKLRLLPCSHVYHTKCIDPWLTKNKRCCPICKRKVIPGADPDDDSDSSEDDGDAPSENTPLLGGGNGPSSSTGNRRSTFANSGLPTPIARVTHVNEADASTSDSDQSDSELGATGGLRHLNLAKDNPLLSLGRKSPVEEFKPKGTNQEAAECGLANGEPVQGLLANQGRVDIAVIETGKRSSESDRRSLDGLENSGFVVEGEGEETDEEDEEGAGLGYHDDSEVAFLEGGKKEEKKTNGII